MYYVCMYECMYVCMYVCIYIYIYIATERASQRGNAIAASGPGRGMRTGTRSERVGDKRSTPTLQRLHL